MFKTPLLTAKAYTSSKILSMNFLAFTDGKQARDLS